ncbi:hypothetical protein [Leptospira sp. P2653]|uniref:hypothetical protein n=1 Tax=Leptospira sp. P2653 TaxID=1218600 RepID=UPI0002BDB290|nr:hypothetical protein [Leptospira sp. P2653]EMJ62099.1 hypothetical protein LEP1GSC051_0136 [Leptospira sp. P2653]
MPSFLGPFTNEDFPEDNRLKKLNVAEAEIDFSNAAGTLNLGDILQVNSVVVQVFVRVLTPFNGSPSLTVGDTITADKWLDVYGTDLSLSGIFLGFAFEILTSLTQARVYWSPNGCSAGKLRVYLLVSDP